jgi:topoisomerase-4 subunit A
VRPQELPGGKGDGVPVSSLAEMAGTTIVGLVSAVPETPVLLASTGGFALRAKVAGFVTDRRAGKQFVSVGEGESLLPPWILTEGVKEVAALSRDKRLLVFPLEEVNELPNGGRGVTAMKLHDNEPMVGLKPVVDKLDIATIGRITAERALERAVRCRDP